MIITLGGLPGSGKTTKARMLSERLGMKWYSMGDLRGKMAAERGITIDQLNELGLEHDFTDKEVDDFQRRLGENEDNFVADGRMSWHFIPNALKIFLTIDQTEAARRVFADQQNAGARSDEATYTSVEEAAEALKNRTANDRARYLKHYGVDYLDPKNYDVVIDTTQMTAEESYQEILKLVKARKNE